MKQNHSQLLELWQCIREAYICSRKTSFYSFFKENQNCLLSVLGGTTKIAGAATEEAGLVGEVDGRGFGVGVASPSLKANVGNLVGVGRKLKSRKAKDRNGSEERKSPMTQTGTEPGPGIDNEDVAQSVSPTLPQSPSQRPGTPPPKREAFEEFKQERGSEISRILNENKGNVR